MLNCSLTLPNLLWESSENSNNFSPVDTITLSNLSNLLALSFLKCNWMVANFSATLDILSILCEAIIY